MTTPPTRVAIVGSCVSRDPFAFENPSDLRVVSYLARQSFAGLAGPALAFDPEWYGSVNEFERRCVVADLTKGEDYWRFERGADLLVLDYVDERFDLLAVGEALVSNTKHLRQPGFEARHPFELRKRLSDETFALWARGARLFLDRAAKTFPASRIVLHAARWAGAFRDKAGAERPFPDAAPIVANNDLLARQYAFTRAALPGLSVLTPPANVAFADPEHRWSKEPFHYVPEYYAWFLEALRALAPPVC